MHIFTTDDYKLAVRKLRLKTKDSLTSSSAMFECPFHSDYHPSLSINFDTGCWNCFQCHRGGHLTKLSYLMINKSLMVLLNIKPDLSDLNEVMVEEKEQVYRRKVFHTLDIRGRFIPYYNSDRAKEYIRKRGISFNIADSMKFQYCTEAYINGTYFKDRVIIPIYDNDGNYINVEGRAIEKSDLKCLYPKSGVKPLFEWYSLNTENTLYLFEGILKMAVARSDTFFMNSSATLGSMVTDYQLSQLNKFKSVTLIRDMDDAGMVMAKKIKEKYIGNYKVWLLSSSIKDVDEIPSVLNMGVKEYREQGGFIEDIEFL